MNIEQMLEDEFRVVAGELDVPPAPVAELVREGTKARNRSRMYVAGAAAAAVAVIVTGLAITDGDPRAGDEGPSTEIPSPTVSVGPDDLAIGETPRLPWIDNDQRLHVGDDVIGGQFLEVAGVEPWIYAVRLDGGDAAWVHIVDGQAELALGNMSPPGDVSPNGRWWATIRVEDDGRHTLVRYDAENPDDRPTHDLGQPGGEADGAIGVGGVDDLGRVYSANLGGGIMWVPETGAIVELRQGDGLYWELTDIGPEGPAVADGPGQDSVLTVMADDGTIESQLPLPNVVDDRLSPAGTRTAWLTDHRGRDLQRKTGYSGVLDAVTVQELATGELTTIPLPKGSDISQLLWEDEATVLLKITLDRESGRSLFARCDVTTSACELAGNQ